jgi:hypothetical protein
LFLNAVPSGKSVCLPFGDFFNSCFDELFLNFTHRTAHGGDGDKAA